MNELLGFKLYLAQGHSNRTNGGLFTAQREDGTRDGTAPVTTEPALPRNIKFCPRNSDGSARRVSLSATFLIMPGRIPVPRHY